MTIGQLARTFSPTLSDDDIDYLMFNETAYPFGDLCLVTYQLRSAIRAGRNGIERCELCGAKSPHHKSYCLNKPKPEPRQ